MSLLLALALAAAAPPADAAVFIVRHAERADAKDDASLLSRAGKRRARELSRVLAGVDLKAVYCTEYERTQQTAAPVAEAKKLTPVVLGSDKTDELARALKDVPPDRDVLVVGHTDTIPDLLAALGVERRIDIPSTVYDDLFVLTPQEGKAPRLLRLRYGR